MMTRKSTQSQRISLYSACILAVSLFVLTACGQKGPLYLPQDENNPQEKPQHQQDQDNSSKPELPDNTRLEQTGGAI